MKDIIKFDPIDDIVGGRVICEGNLDAELSRPGTRILSQWTEKSTTMQWLNGSHVPNEFTITKFLIVRTMDKESRLSQLQCELDLSVEKKSHT